MNQAVQGRIGYEWLLFVAFVFGTVLVFPDYVREHVLLATILVAAVLAAHVLAREDGSLSLLSRAPLVVAAGFLAWRFAREWPFAEYEVAQAAGYLFALGAVVALPSVVRSNRSWLVAWGAAVAAAFVLMGWPVFDLAGDPDIDVYDLHVAGAEALASGDNPYVVAVADNTSPLAGEGDVFAGYTYPPLALALYSPSQWIFSEPRVTSLLALGVFMSLMLVAAARFERDAARRLTLGLVLVLGVWPGLASVVNKSWTEPISLGFAVGAALAWSRRPWLAWVLLGLLFASKQYWILAIPLLLVMPDPDRWRRAAVAGGVAFVTLLPALIVDTGAFLDAAVIPSFSAEPRFDAANLAGLGIDVPGFVGTAAAVLLAVVLGRKVKDASGFFAALGAVLAVNLYLGFGAFANHWLMVTALVAVALVARAGSVDPARPRSGQARAVVEAPVPSASVGAVRGDDGTAA